MGAARGFLVRVGCPVEHYRRCNEEVGGGCMKEVKCKLNEDLKPMWFSFCSFLSFIAPSLSAASKLMTKCIVTNEPPGCQNSANTPGRLFGSSLLLSGLLFYQKLPRV